jgi:hypothetical protein
LSAELTVFVKAGTEGGIIDAAVDIAGAGVLKTHALTSKKSKGAEEEEEDVAAGGLTFSAATGVFGLEANKPNNPFLTGAA